MNEGKPMTDNTDKLREADMTHEPDAEKWATFFKQTFPDSDKDLMFGWFANSMMAMHNYLLFGDGQDKARAALNTTPTDTGLVEDAEDLFEDLDLFITVDNEKVRDRILAALKQPATPDREAVESLRDIADEARDPDGAGTMPTDPLTRIDTLLKDADHGS